MSLSNISILLCLSVLIAAVCAQVSDPEAWTADTGGMYYYKVVTPADYSNNTWDNARAACQNVSEFGDLASIRHANDTVLLHSMVSTISTWIGLVWINETGEWKYLDSPRDPLPDFRQRNNEPNGNQSEPCGRIEMGEEWQSDPRTRDGINDVQCFWTTFSYACEVRSYEAGGAEWPTEAPTGTGTESTTGATLDPVDQGDNSMLIIVASGVGVALALGVGGMWWRLRKNPEIPSL